MSRKNLGLFSDCTFAGAFVDATELAMTANRRNRTQAAESAAEVPTRPIRWQLPEIRFALRPAAFARGLGVAAVVLSAGLIAGWLA